MKKITVLMLVLLLAGCTVPGTPQTPTPAASVTSTIAPNSTKAPVSGGTLTVPMPAKPATTHPLFIQETEMSNLYSMIFEPLIALNEKREPTACLAESWEYNGEDGCFVVRLRSGVRWHNGTEMTAADVVFTVETILSDTDSLYYDRVSKYVAKVEAVDIYTVSFTPKIKSYAFYFALNIPIIPAVIYEDAENIISIVPIGSGPFAVSDIQIGEQSSMELLRNTTWWKKQPYIEKVRAIGYKDNDTAVEAFINGELDCVSTDTYTTDVYTIQDGVECYNYLSNFYDFIAVNFKNPLLADVNIRRAVSYAVDRKSILANIYTYHGIACENPFAPDSFLASGDADKYDYMLSYACKLLDSLGWEAGEDGIREKDGKRMSFNIVTVLDVYNPMRTDTAAMIKRQLALAGIEIKVVSLSLNDFNTRIAEKDFDMALTGYYFSDIPDPTFALDSHGSGNIGGYNDMTMDNLLADLSAAVTKDDYSACYAELQKYTAREQPQIGMYYIYHSLLHRSSVYPAGINRDGRVYENIEKWFIQE